MNIYLAGPMRGYDDLNRPAFNTAAARLRLEGHTVFSPAELPEDMQNDIRACFGTDFDHICRRADAIALLPGWKDSLGAVAEEALARAIGLDIIYLAD